MSTRSTALRVNPEDLEGLSFELEKFKRSTAN
jgi:hypothetical protein